MTHHGPFQLYLFHYSVILGKLTLFLASQCQDLFSRSLNDFTDADVFTRPRINSKTWQQFSSVLE